MEGISTEIPTFVQDDRLPRHAGDRACVTWNTKVRMYAVPPESGDAEIAQREANWLIARYEGGELVAVPP